MDRIIYPALDRRGYHMSLRVRIMIGMAFGVLAVACAGGVEMYRRHVYWLNGTQHVHWQTIGNTDYRAAGVHILFQTPQYCLIGISEAFASVASLELAYLTAPRSMQGIIMGLFWFTQGLASIFGSLLMSAFHGTWFFDWDSGDINCQRCHLDYYFFFLAGVQFVGAFAFLAISYYLKIGGKIPSRHHTTSSSSASRDPFAGPPEDDSSGHVQYGSITGRQDSNESTPTSTPVL